MCVCVCVCLTALLAHGGGEGSREALERVYFPLPLREREPLTDAFLSNIPGGKKGSFCTVAVQLDCAGPSDLPPAPK